MTRSADEDRGGHTRWRRGLQRLTWLGRVALARRSPPPREDSISTLDLRRVLEEPGCPLCRLVRRGEENWLWSLLYEFNGDPHVHARFAGSFGLCASHGALLELVVRERRLMTASAVARLYESALRRWRQAAPGQLPAAGQCLLCEYAHGAEDRYGYFLARALVGQGWRATYARSDGLCRPHLANVCAHASATIRGWLTADFAARLSELTGRLQELQRKQRYDVPDVPTPAEVASWREAVWRMGGMHFDRLLICDR